MQKKYTDDVVTISLNLDHDQPNELPPKDLQDEVLEKLVELKLEIANVMSSEDYENALARHDMFSLPAAIIYDRDGKEFRKFEGDLSYEKQVFPLIAEMLSAGDNETPAVEPTEGDEAAPAEPVIEES